MNKFVLSALALTTAGGLATAGTGSEEWLTLDREIESLASTQQATAASTSGVTVSGFIRSSYQNSSDVETDSGNDLGGFYLDNARVNVTGTIGNYMLYVQMDAVDDGVSSLWSYEPDDGLLTGGLFQSSEVGSFGVLDAYAAWNISDQFRLTMGQFRSPFLGASQRDENQLLFLDRSVSGLIWSNRDQGVMLSGQYDMLGWWIAAQNGLDGAGDDLAFSARVAFDAMGAQPKVEGAYGAPEGTNLGISAGYYQDDDTLVDDVAAWNVEAKFIMGPLYVAGSYIDHDDGFAGLASNAGLNVTEGPAIMMLEGSFMFVPDRWEAAVRYEDLDDEDDTTFLTFGVNYYAVGHDAKWQLNYVMADSDNDALDADLIGIGLTVGV